MDSTAILHPRFSAPPLPPLPTTTPSLVLRPQLALFTFPSNNALSSAHLLLKKSNANYNTRYGSLNKKNNAIDIQCNTLNTSEPPRSNDDRNFPFANARLALQSLLCFSYSPKNVDHTDFLNNEKKKALQALLSQNHREVERIIKSVESKYKNNPNEHIQYEAKMAIIQILIHMGTVESWRRASKKYTEITNMKKRPSDATILLYSAVIRTLLGDTHNIEEHWHVYVDTIGSDPTMSSG